MRLSRHQVSLVLSSIWAQATMTGNTPANFEAMAQTYSLALFFTLSKVRSIRKQLDEILHLFVFYLLNPLYMTFSLELKSYGINTVLSAGVFP